MDTRNNIELLNPSVNAKSSNEIHPSVPNRVSFKGGLGGEHSPPLALACPLGNFVLTVNQFKCFEIFNNCYA